MILSSSNSYWCGHGRKYQPAASWRSKCCWSSLIQGQVVEWDEEAVDPGHSCYVHQSLYVWALCHHSGLRWAHWLHGISGLLFRIYCLSEVRKWYTGMSLLLLVPFYFDWKKKKKKIPRWNMHLLHQELRCRPGN